MMVTWGDDGRDAEKWMDLKNILEGDSTGCIVQVEGKGEV